MNDFILSGIAIGLLAVAGLLIVSVRRHRKPTLIDGASVFLAGAGVSLGVKVCLLAINGPFQADENTCVFLGGLAATWVAIEVIFSTILKHT